MSLSPIPQEKFTRQTSNSSQYDDDDAEIAGLTQQKPAHLDIQREGSSSTFMARSSVLSMSSSGSAGTPMQDMLLSGFNSPAPTQSYSKSESKSDEDLEDTAYWEELYTRYVDLFYFLVSSIETGAKGTFEDLERMGKLLEKHPAKFDLEPSYHPLLSPQISHSLKPLDIKRVGSVFPKIFSDKKIKKKKINH